LLEGVLEAGRLKRDHIEFAFLPTCSSVICHFPLRPKENGPRRLAKGELYACRDRRNLVDA
jgi:hypothetical protein